MAARRRRRRGQVHERHADGAGGQGRLDRDRSPTLGRPRQADVPQQPGRAAWPRWSRCPAAPAAPTSCPAPCCSRAILASTDAATSRLDAGGQPGAATVCARGGLSTSAPTRSAGRRPWWWSAARSRARRRRTTAAARRRLRPAGAGAGLRRLRAPVRRRHSTDRCRPAGGSWSTAVREDSDATKACPPSTTPTCRWARRRVVVAPWPSSTPGRAGQYGVAGDAKAVLPDARPAGRRPPSRRARRPVELHRRAACPAGRRRSVRRRRPPRAAARAAPAAAGRRRRCGPAPTTRASRSRCWRARRTPRGPRPARSPPASRPGAGPAAVAGPAPARVSARSTTWPATRRSKGLRGHLAALARGEVTTRRGQDRSAWRLTGLAAAAVDPAPTRRRPGGVAGPSTRAGRGAVVAGAANLANLLDLRPGRALKVDAALAAAAAARGPAAPRRPRALPRRPRARRCGALPDDLAGGRCSATPGPTAPAPCSALALRRAHRAARPARRAGGADRPDPRLARRSASPRSSSRRPGLRELDALGRRPRPMTRRSRPGQRPRAGAGRRRDRRSGRADRRRHLLARVAGFARWLVFSGSVGTTCVGDVYHAANTAAQRRLRGGGRWGARRRRGAAASPGRWAVATGTRPTAPPRRC